MIEKLDVPSPLVLRASAFIRLALLDTPGKSPYLWEAMYKLFLIGAVGSLKKLGATNRHVAIYLRDYANQLEKS